MDKRFYRFLQCMIVLGLAIYLADKFVSGQLSYYINLRFSILTLVSIALLAILAAIGLSSLFAGQQPAQTALQGEESRPKGTINWFLLPSFPLLAAFLGLSVPVVVTAFIFVFIVGITRLYPAANAGSHSSNPLSGLPKIALVVLAVPLILGVFVPVRPLSTSALSTRGMSLSAPGSLNETSLKSMEVAPDDRTILDWLKLFYSQENFSPDPETPASVIGFVYHDPRLQENQFMVGRFSITCCVADAFAIGMAVDWPDSANLEENTWVNVKGPVGVLTIDGQKVPVIQAQSVTPVQSPDQPYLYP